MSSSLPPAAAYEALARQAYAYARLLCGRGRFGRDVWRKADEAARFSASTNARSLAVPSKLVGVRPFQASLAALAALQPPFGLRLDLVREDGAQGDGARGDGDGPRLVVRVAATTAAGSVAGATLGHVQAKHVPWLLDLVPLGVEVRLTRVTGGGARGLFGCNVAFTGVGAALGRLARYGPACSGDGARPPAAPRAL